jgi:hypothetical protein
MAHWRTASGLRRTCPDRGGERLRSDGQVVSSSAAAALTLSGRSASWKTRWASAQSARSGWAASHPWLERSLPPPADRFGGMQDGVDRATAMLASAVKLGRVVAEQGRILRDPANC